ncbi:hypothetical protein Q7P37_001466 [Cladosporium fusiforme]
MAAKMPTSRADAGIRPQQRSEQLDFSDDGSGLHPVQPGLEPLPSRDEHAPESYQADEHVRQKQPYAYDGSADQPRSLEHERILGLPRRVFWWICGFLLLAAVVAAVVGGVLGSRSDSNESATSSSHASSTSARATDSTKTASPTPVAARERSVIAVIASPGGSKEASTSLYVYWQDKAGDIIEGTYSGPSFERSIRTTVVVEAHAPAGAPKRETPIAAVSWLDKDDGSQKRALFYVEDANGLLMTKNTTSDWSDSSAPYNILRKADFTFAEGSSSLAACVNTTIGQLNGIRVYFASQLHGLLGEASRNFDPSDTHWGSGTSFPDTDVTSGVACTVEGSRVKMYYRNSSTFKLEAQSHDFSPTARDSNWGKACSRACASVMDWKADESDLADATGDLIPEEAHIAAYHDSPMDRIVWRVADGNLQLGYNEDRKISSVNTTLDKARSGSRVATIGTDGGPLVIYQSEANQTRLAFERVDLGDMDASTSKGWIMD